MHIICSNLGSIQPESKVAVWSTSAKPAMPGSQASSGICLSWHVACATPKAQQHAPAVAKVEGTCATPHADAAACAPAVAEPEVDDIAKHGDIEDEVANMSQQEQLMLSPAQFRDIATGEPISNQRCLEI